MGGDSRATCDSVEILFEVRTLALPCLRNIPTFSLLYPSSNGIRASAGCVYSAYDMRANLADACVQRTPRHSMSAHSRVAVVLGILFFPLLFSSHPMAAVGLSSPPPAGSDHFVLGWRRREGGVLGRSFAPGGWFSFFLSFPPIRPATNYPLT